jgi:hypothetical protein
MLNFMSWQQAYISMLFDAHATRDSDLDELSLLMPEPARFRWLRRFVQGAIFQYDIPVLHYRELAETSLHEIQPPTVSKPVIPDMMMAPHSWSF